MQRKEFIKYLGLLPVMGGVAMKLNALNKLMEISESTEQLPVLFVGHGNPMNAIEDNAFSREMKNIATQLPKPKAILMISAHWETKGTHVTAMEHPPTIHDFGGFPPELFAVQYPAPGSKELAAETKNTIKKTAVELSQNWGLDHGCWGVTRNMFPLADVPIVQLSLDYTQGPLYHYELAKELAILRQKGVLIIGSGNMVHNLGRIALQGNDFNAPYGLDWALEANALFKKFILSGDHQSLIHYRSLGKSVELAVPTPEHFLPLLYIMALKGEKETIKFFNDIPVAGSITMTSLLVR